MGIFLSMGFFTKHIFADTTDIIVTPIQPANQLSDVTYFDLLVRSDTNQKLQMNVKNTTNKAINVNLKPLNSFTNNNGLITYNEDKIGEENNGISFTNLVKEKNLDIKVMIGGAPVTQEYCDEIGADFYTDDATSASEVAAKIIIEKGN